MTDVSEHPLSGTVDIEFVEVVPVEDEPPARHASEEMYGIALGAGLDADLLLMTGSEPRNIVERLGAAAGAPSAHPARLGASPLQESERLAAQVTVRPLSAVVDNDATRRA